ncbi:NUDIX hydrolase [Lysobacter enzymogenes]|uniref:NUDIX hydrolase n=1 Tax=Lysobacter enzymogenes TaxID=69 RepID=A0AAU9AGJ4_LYSEN|nr:NUDIX domain-containing protein [Lysobacter enzymogenes]BAV97033.1 NUDIX hydrolase [Lysobacter enzymogenes]
MSTIDKVAWIHLRDGKILSTRSRGKDRFYIPGGKREAGESDVDCLQREVREELAVELQADSIDYLATFQAQAHGHPDGVLVKMICYAADPMGEPTASAEIEEWQWLGYADRERASVVDGLVFDWLRERGLLV